MSLLKAIRNYFVRAGEEAEAAEAAHRPHGAKGPENGCRAVRDANEGGQPWIGVDLDGTLAVYEEGASIAKIGPPVEAMMARVQRMLDEGWCVKIVTARAALPEQLPLIQKWLRENGLPPLEITHCKDFSMVMLYDDRCIQVEINTGNLIQ